MQQLGLQGQLSQADLDLAKKNPDAGIKLLDAKTKWNAATDDIGRKTANAEAEKIRSTYGGYTGGTAGAEWNINAPKTPSSFSSEYDDLILNEIKSFNDKKYEYDPTKDPVYSSYKKAYTREGKRTIEDTMASAAAMTGGIPSSYAVAAGQQAGNYYASQIADKIPELEAEAYRRHEQEKADLLTYIGMLQDERQTAYDKHIDDINYDIKMADREISAEDRLISQAYDAAELGDFSQLEKLGILIPEHIKNAAKREIENKQDQQKFENDLLLAQFGAQLGDYSKAKDMNITPDIEAIKSANEKTPDYNTAMADIASRFGETKFIPLNELESLEYKYPGIYDMAIEEGYRVGLTEDVVSWLESQYPNQLIPAEDWDFLIEAGFDEVDLKTNGFKKKVILKGH
jgi:hypothetical protein